MAIKKFLSESGFKHFVEKVIGKTDISSIGDGTIKDAVSSLNESLAIKTITPTMLNGFILSEPDNIRIKANNKMLTVSQQIQIPTISRDNWYEIWRWTLPLECDFYVRTPIVFNDGVSSYVDVHIYTQGVRVYLPIKASGQTLQISGTTISWF